MVVMPKTSRMLMMMDEDDDLRWWSDGSWEHHIYLGNMRSLQQSLNHLYDNDQPASLLLFTYQRSFKLLFLRFLGKLKPCQLQVETTRNQVALSKTFLGMVAMKVWTYLCGLWVVLHGRIPCNDDRLPNIVSLGGLREKSLHSTWCGLSLMVVEDRHLFVVVVAVFFKCW